MNKVSEKKIPVSHQIRHFHFKQNIHVILLINNSNESSQPLEEMYIVMID